MAAADMRPPWFVPTAHAASSCLVIAVVRLIRFRSAITASWLEAAPTATSRSFVASAPLLERVTPVSVSARFAASVPSAIWVQAEPVSA